MISRRVILSRSGDNLNLQGLYNEDEDVWPSVDKFIDDHIQEILQNWDRIDDEIWAKVVCMQKNRRIAKAFARAPVITINGSYIGFDGHRIGLNGFNCPLNDHNIEQLKTQIGSGAKIKIDDEGNIFIKRVGKENVFVKQVVGRKSNCISDQLVKNNGQLVVDRSVKLFDMDKFMEQIEEQMNNSYPDRKLLEYQCLSCVAFVKDCRNIMELPVWVMIVNIVALDLLKSRLISLPNGSRAYSQPPVEDCLDYHRVVSGKCHSHTSGVDHHKCSANRLTLRRWRALYGPLMPALPPRDTERDEKIKKLRHDLEEVKHKIGQIESQYSMKRLVTRQPSTAFSLKKSLSDYSLLNLWPKRQTNPKTVNNNSVYDSGLDSDPYGSDSKSSQIYG